MPNKVKVLATGGEVHSNPIVGKHDHSYAIRVDISALPAAYVDADGWLKPGMPLRRGGLPISAPAQFVWGVVTEAVRVHTNNTTLASVTADIDVAISMFCMVNRGVLEDSLGRVLTADEIAAFDAAGSKVALLY